MAKSLMLGQVQLCPKRGADHLRSGRRGGPYPTRMAVAYLFLCDGELCERYIIPQQSCTLASIS
jgi:hypothetical protein